MVGIYRIKNLINEKSYYGSSKNIEKRWKKHLNELRKKKHINNFLQNAWNKYGENNFIFEIVQECEEKDLLVIEQKYIDLFGYYNIGLKSRGGDNLTKNPNKMKIIEKIKKGNKLWLNNLSNDEKKQHFSRPLDKNPNWKGGLTYNFCKCGKRIGYKHKHCQKCQPKNGKNNPFYGKKHSEEFKKKISFKRMGVYNGNQNIPIIIDEIEFNSFGDASKKLEIPITTIRWRILSKNPKYKNYKFKDKENFSYTNEEQKERLSKPQRELKRNHNKPFLIDNVKYETLKNASDKLKIHQMTIKGRLISLNFPNYKYIN